MPRSPTPVRPRPRSAPENNHPSFAGLRAGDTARTLDRLATVLISIVSALAILSIAGGVAVVAATHDRDARLVGAIIMGGAVIFWLFSLLPYLAAQAVARYITWRLEAYGAP